MSNLFSPSDNVVAKEKEPTSLVETTLPFIVKSTCSLTVHFMDNCLCPLPKILHRLLANLFQELALHYQILFYMFLFVHFHYLKSQ